MTAMLFSEEESARGEFLKHRDDRASTSRARYNSARDGQLGHWGADEGLGRRQSLIQCQPNLAGVRKGTKQIRRRRLNLGNSARSQDNDSIGFSSQLQFS